MNVTFEVEIQLERVGGKFAPREEVVDALREQLEQAAGEGVSGVGADGDTEYEASDYTITEIERPKAGRR
jgi:hypothetical protein